MFNRFFEIFRSNKPQKRLLLYGLQRSGTNYLETMVLNSLPGSIFLNGEQRNEITHKHFRLYDDKTKIPEPQFYNDSLFENFTSFVSALPVEPDLFIIISKDPYSWLSSYQKWSSKNKWPEHNYHYLEEYNLFYGKWHTFSSKTKNMLFIRYEDLLLSPKKVINTIATALELPTPKKVATTKKVYASRTFTEGKKEAFINRDHVKEFTTEQLATINNLLDPALMEFLGYKMEFERRDTLTP